MNINRFHVAFIAVLIFLLVISSISDPGVNIEADQRPVPDSPDLIKPVPNGSLLWPYTSTTQSFDRRTLGINFILRGDERDIRSHLQRHTEDDWRTRPHPEEPVNGSEEILPVDDTAITWRVAHGSTRYTYVQSSGRSTDEKWLVESYQLYDGSYLGSRYHIRAYASPDTSENWTAIQAHKEYWDWFRLRHTVTSIAEAQQRIEADLIDDSSIDSLWRRYLDNADTSDGDGWATIVEFATIILLAGLLRSFREGAKTIGKRLQSVLESQRRERILERGLLFGGIVLIAVGVRLVGVTLEQSLPGISPKVVAGVLYPTLVLGLPLCAGYFSRTLQMENAFLLTIVAFATALLFDFTYLNLTALPIRIVLHRVALVLSLGLIAAGSAYYSHGGPRWNELVQIGLAGWFIALLLALIGLA